MNVAFLIIDVQKKYVELPDFKETYKAAIEYINYVSAIFREASQPVIHIRHVETNENLDDENFQVDKAIVQKDGDIYLNKHYGNGFWKTDLQKILEDKNVDYVICSGLSATHCVLATYNGAIERGFNVSMLQNGLVGRGWEEVNTVQKNFNIIGYNGIRYILNLTKK